MRLAPVLICVVLFAIPAGAQPRLSDEDCYRIAIQEARQRNAASAGERTPKIDRSRRSDEP